MHISTFLGFHRPFCFTVFYKISPLDRTLQYRADVRALLSLHRLEFSVYTHTLNVTGMALANQAGYATTFAYITNSLRRG